MAGDEAQEQLNAYYDFCRDEVLRSSRRQCRMGQIGADGPLVELPPDLVESQTVALTHGETDGLGFYAEISLMEDAFASRTWCAVAGGGSRCCRTCTMTAWRRWCCSAWPTDTQTRRVWCSGGC
jgi:hypothetical protein